MKNLLTKFKGWVTVSSVTAVLVDVFAVKNQIVPTFTEAANVDFSLLGLVGAVGAVVGLVRKFTQAYKAA